MTHNLSSLDLIKKEIENYCSEIKEDSSAIFDSIKDKADKSLNKSKSAIQKANQKIKEPSLLEFLPYVSFDPKTCVFENKTTQGFVIRVSHFTGINERSKSSLRNLIANDIPADCTVQVINYASPRIGNIVDYWFNSGSKGEIYKKITEKRQEFFKSGSWQSILGDRQNLLVRDFELYFCFSFPKALTESGKTENVLKLKALQEKITEGFKGIDSISKILDGREFARFVGEILSPSQSIYKNYAFDKCTDVKDYFKSDLKLEMNSDRIKFGEFNYVTFEVTAFPEIWDLENSINYVGQFDSTGNSGTSALPCPFYISYGFTMKSREDSERTANKHRMIKTQQGDSKLPMFFPRMLEEIHDWRYVSERINQGERLGKAVIYIVLLAGSTEQADKASSLLADHFARLKFKIEKVKYDTVNSFLATLPFGIAENWQILDQLKVPATLLSGAAMNLMPVFADTQNYLNPLMMFVARRGQLFFFDNFRGAGNTNGNYNMVIVGKSGRGKSVWMQEYAISLLRNGGQVIIIDDGRSFKNTCEILGGDFVDFGGGNFCINPFSLYRESSDFDDSKEYKEFFVSPLIDLIISILCIFLKIDKNNDESTEVAVRLTALENAIKAVLKKKGSGGGFRDIMQELLTNPEIKTAETEIFCNEAVYILKTCAEEDERYEEYFNGVSTLNINNDFTVFELSDLQNDVRLQNAVLMTIVFLVYAKMQSRERRTALMIDEFWRLGKHPLLKDPIEGFARRGRKYNLSLILATQSMEEFSKEKCPAGSAALAQSDWQIMFSASGEDYDMLRDILKMTPAEIDIAYNLQGIEGYYSEFMIRHSEGSWQIGRLLLDRFSVKLYSSKAEDVAAVKKMRKAGISVEEAIERLMS